MNLFELRAAVEAYVQSDEATFLENLDVFIRMSERELYRTIDFPVEVGTQEFNLLTGDAEITLPSNFASPIGLTAIPTSPPYLPEPIYFRDLDYIKGVYGTTATMSSGKPRDAAATDTKIIVAPKLDANYTLNLTFNAYPDSITVVDSGESWLSKYGEEALLYTAVGHALVFLKADKEAIEILESRRGPAVEKLGKFARDWFKK